VARPTEYRNIALNKFAGLNLLGQSELIPENTFSDLLNMESGMALEVKKRPGIVRQHGGATLGANYIIWIGALQTILKQHLLVQSVAIPNGTGGSGKLWQSHDSGVTWTQVSTPGATNYSFFKGIQYLLVYYIPTSTGLTKWDGTTFTTPIAGTPNASSPAAFSKFRIFYLDTAGNLRFSDPGNLASIPAGNSIGLVGNEEVLFGPVAYRERILLPLSNSIWVLNIDGPPQSWSIRENVLPLGVMGNRSIVIVNDLLYILSWDGVYRSDLTRVEEISLPIKPIFANRRQQAKNLFGPIDSIGYWNGRIICSIFNRQ
jgi:hypothetical protein